jgi:hypothetical protein
VKEQSDSAGKAAKAALDEQQRARRADAAAAHGEASKFKRQAAATGEGGAAARAALEAAHQSALACAASRSEALLVEQAALAAARAATVGLPPDSHGQAGWQPGSGRKVSEKELAACLAAHETSRRTELQLLRQQYEHW